MSGTIDRAELVADILADRGDDLQSFAAWDRALMTLRVSKVIHVPFIHGTALSVSLGIAAQPEKRVLVVTGDGDADGARQFLDRSSVAAQSQRAGA